MAIHLANAGAEAAPPHTDLYVCPISTCDWTYEPPPLPIPDPSVLAGILGPGALTMQALRHHRIGLEAVLEEHFASHTPAEYITEISSLKGLNLGLVKQMQELVETFKDVIKASPNMHREVDPAVQQLSAVLGQYPGTGH